MIVPLVRTAPVAIDKHAGNLAFLSGLGGQNLIIERTTHCPRRIRPRFLRKPGQGNLRRSYMLSNTNTMRIAFSTLAFPDKTQAKAPTLLARNPMREFPRQELSIGERTALSSS
jgi:hypothetical protein